MPLMPDSAQEDRFLFTSPLGDEDIFQPARLVQGNPYLVVKGCLDFVLAALLLVLTAPIILFCALLVKLTSRGPAFYSQTRLGRGGRPYRIYKLRTMGHLSEANSGPQWSRNGDPRVTRPGRFLRRTHLDELPQLWNILRGEMSLVGPRPERPEFIPALARAVPLYSARMCWCASRSHWPGPGAALPADTDLDSVPAPRSPMDLYYVGQAEPGVGSEDPRVATGFKVLGASFGFMRKAFLLPARVVIEQSYRSLQIKPLQAADSGRNDHLLGAVRPPARTGHRSGVDSHPMNRCLGSSNLGGLLVANVSRLETANPVRDPPSSLSTG